MKITQNIILLFIALLSLSAYGQNTQVLFLSRTDAAKTVVRDFFCADGRKSGDWLKIIQAYLACVCFVDYKVRRILKALQKSKYAEMLSGYPTLLELFGLPAYEKNKGILIVSVMKENITLENSAITTYGMNIHSDYNLNPT